jgi:hypothetical protein
MHFSSTHVYYMPLQSHLSFNSRSSVYELDGRGSIPGRCSDGIFTRHRVKIGSVTHPAFIKLVGGGAFSAGVKLTTHHHLVPRLSAWSSTFSPALRLHSVAHITQHKDSFAFTCLVKSRSMKVIVSNLASSSWYFLFIRTQYFPHHFVLYLNCKYIDMVVRKVCVTKEGEVNGDGGSYMMGKLRDEYIFTL